jgi:hypothetical protein
MREDKWTVCGTFAVGSKYRIVTTGDKLAEVNGRSLRFVKEAPYVSAWKMSLDEISYN